MQKNKPYVIIPYSKESSNSKFKFSTTISVLTPHTEPGLKLRSHSIVVVSYQTFLELCYFFSWFRFHEIFDIYKRITICILYLHMYNTILIKKPLLIFRNKTLAILLRPSECFSPILSSSLPAKGKQYF